MTSTESPWPLQVQTGAVWRGLGGVWLGRAPCPYPGQDHATVASNSELCKELLIKNERPETGWADPCHFWILQELVWVYTAEMGRKLVLSN